MSRLIDLELKTGTVWLSCPWDAQIVGTIKTIPGREFDKSSRRWSVPIAQVAMVIERLEPLHFRFTPRMRDWWKQNRDSLPAPNERGVEEVVVDPDDGYSVSRLNEEARRVLTEHFGEVWVVAELDGFDKNKSDAHAYFELVERTASGGQPIARVRAVMFASARKRVEGELPDDVSLSDGLRMRLRGKVELYAPTGSYQVVVEGIDVDWAIGARRRKRDEVLEQLAREGIAELNLARELPVLPLRVGLVTAQDSDAYNDFVHELERSGYAFEVLVHPAKMQGRDAEPSIVAALGELERHARELDVVVVTRGGGSRGDLGYFDSLGIGRAVCRLPVKVIAGIGHHRDRGVLDFVALSAKTPTAAAQLLVAQVARTEARVQEAGAAVVAGVRRALDRARQRADRAAGACERAATRRLVGAQRAVDHAAQTTERAVTKRLSVARRAVDRAGVRIAERGLLPLLRAGERVDRAHVELRRAAVARIASQGLQVDHIEAKLRLADPRRVVERGFAIVRDTDGRVITTARAVNQLESARLQMRDGEARVIVPQGASDE